MPITTMHPYIGADIELFATKKVEKEYNVIGATSVISEPIGRKKNITNDGMLIEVNPRPYTCRDSLFMGIREIVRDLGKLETNKNIKVKLASIHDIPRLTFDKMSQSDKEIGCLPDVNAYTGELNDIPSEYERIPFRTCGGHIHIGAAAIGIERKNFADQQYPLELKNTRKYFYGNGEYKYNRTETVYNERGFCIGTELKEYIYKQRNIHDIPWNRWINCIKEEMHTLSLCEINKGKIKYSHDTYGITKALVNPLDTVKMLDLFVGIPAVLMEQGENPKLRRRLYGKSGSFRYTPYGLEYRVLSNFWMASPALMSLFTGLSRFAVNIMGEYLMKTNSTFHLAGKKAWNWLNKEENILNLRVAIDENEFNLAKNIYDDIIEPIFEEYKFNHGLDMPLSTLLHRLVFKYVAMNGGYEKFWTSDKLKKNWTYNNISGWHSWIDNDIVLRKFTDNPKDINEKWEEYLK